MPFPELSDNYLAEFYFLSIILFFLADFSLSFLGLVEIIFLPVLLFFTFYGIGLLTEPSCCICCYFNLKSSSYV